MEEVHKTFQVGRFKFVTTLKIAFIEIFASGYFDCFNSESSTRHMSRQLGFTRSVNSDEHDRLWNISFERFHDFVDLLANIGRFYDRSPTVVPIERVNIIYAFYRMSKEIGYLKISE